MSFDETVGFPDDVALLDDDDVAAEVPVVEEGRILSIVAVHGVGSFWGSSFRFSSGTHYYAHRHADPEERP